MAEQLKTLIEVQKVLEGLGQARHACDVDEVQSVVRASPVSSSVTPRLITL